MHSYAPSSPAGISARAEPTATRRPSQSFFEGCRTSANDKYQVGEDIHVDWTDSGGNVSASNYNV
ncbi:hypothetical protein DMC30DRAFT_415911 [Rhodotorula diobovata]|uniref:Uncharacterized protein n=1 Tax=Rhodotorula diobovata TaxID=5288 RepID=A0A5C5FZB2_9BASI|nr:hypothetical protein DMC30DRAFT_415911 [Rhodotorula diobovata]